MIEYTNWEGKQKTWDPETTERYYLLLADVLVSADGAVLSQSASLYSNSPEGVKYWDVTKYPYGGDFRRATEDRPILQILEEVGCRETRVKMLDGSIAVVKTAFIGETI